MAKTMPTSKLGKGRQLSKSGADLSPSSGVAGQAVASANRWREQYNFLRGLMMARAVALLEAGLMGDYPELQRVFALAEMSNGTYVGLVERCLAPFSEFDWEIKTVEEKKLPPGATKEMADAQAATLRNAYDALDNLQEAIEHLALGDFRGFAHLQKQRAEGLAEGDVVHLECLPTWKFSREGLFGAWYWNPAMQSTTTPVYTLGETNRIGSENLPREDFITREVRVPIDRVGLQFFIYTKLAEKNYAGFMEIYGIPGGVVTMPANVPREQLAAFEAAAKAVAEGGSGAIPNGASYTANDSPRASDPFGPFLRYWQEQLILAGTSGKLTMLAESGSGTLAGGAHEDTFQVVASARAKKISECFQKDFDADVLRRKHVGQPTLAYFELCSQDKVNVSALVTDVAALNNCGIKVDPEWLAEKTGYQFLEAAPETDVPTDTLDESTAAIFNRLTRLLNSDVSGHAFHGNQHTGGIPSGVAPDRISTAEADKQLATGVSEQDASGRQVQFGSRLKNKLDRQADGAARKQLLNWGRDTVKIGKAADLKVGAETRTHYGKIFHDASKRRGFLVVVDTKDGQAFNMHITTPSKLGRKIGNRKGANSEEQPSASVLRALVAADNPQGHIKNSMAGPAVNVPELPADLEQQFLTAVAADLAPIVEATREEADAIAQIADPTLRQQKTAALMARLEALTQDVVQAPASAHALQAILNDGLSKGLQ